MLKRPTAVLWAALPEFILVELRTRKCICGYQYHLMSVYTHQLQPCGYQYHFVRAYQTLKGFGSGSRLTNRVRILCILHFTPQSLSSSYIN